MPLGVFQIREDASSLREIGAGPALGKVRTALVAQVSRAELHVATLQRTHGVTGAARVMRGGLDFDLRRRSDQRAGNIVDHAAGDIDFALVADLQRDLKVVAERGRPTPRALDDETIRLRQAAKINRPRQKGAEVPGSHDQEKACVPESRHGPEHAQQRDEKKAPAKAKAQALGLAGANADWLGRKQRLHYFGTSTEPSTSVSTRSLSRPSSSASGFIITRWRSVGSAEAFTSSGIM